MLGLLLRLLAIAEVETFKMALFGCSENGDTSRARELIQENTAIFSGELGRAAPAFVTHIYHHQKLSPGTAAHGNTEITTPPLPPLGSPPLDAADPDHGLAALHFAALHSQFEMVWRSQML